MQNIIDSLPNLIRIETYAKGNQVAMSVAPVDFYFGTETSPLAIAHHDEVPCFFAHKKGYFGAIRVSMKEALEGKIPALVGAALRDNGLPGEGLHVIMGPCLTLFHTPVDEETFAKTMEQYRGACKRTAGIDYIDVPLICLLQFRALGVPMDQIRVGAYDTFENPSLLYSQARGEEEENVTLATLLS